jgi:signal transduction histidine kinase
VSVVLATTTSGFTLTLRDNGKGFEPANLALRPGRGNGLKNMSQRLEKNGGRCAIKSTPGAGTEVEFTLVVPLRARENH